MTEFVCMTSCSKSQRSAYEAGQLRSMAKGPGDVLRGLRGTTERSTHTDIPSEAGV